jgi:hypothetical protein
MDTQVYFGPHKILPKWLHNNMIRGDHFIINNGTTLQKGWAFIKG